MSRGKEAEENLPQAILCEPSLSSPVWPQSRDKVASVQEADSGKTTSQQLWLWKSHMIVLVSQQESSKTPPISIYLACLCVRTPFGFDKFHTM